MFSPPAVEEHGVYCQGIVGDRAIVAMAGETHRKKERSMLERVVPLVLIFGSAAVAVEETGRPSAAEENARFFERV